MPHKKNIHESLEPLDTVEFLENCSDEQFSELLEAGNDYSAISVNPALQHMWTETRMYYAFEYSIGASNIQYLVRFENRWHQLKAKLGNKAYSVTVHPLQNSGKDKKKINIMLKTIKKPLLFFAGVMQTIATHKLENMITNGYAFFMDERSVKYRKLLERVVKRHRDLRMKFDAESMFIGQEEGKAAGGAILLTRKGQDIEKVFSGMVKMLNKYMLPEYDHKDIGIMPEFIKAFQTQMQRTTTEVRKITLTDSDIYMSGKTTSMNEKYRNSEYREPKKNDYFIEKYPQILEEFKKRDIDELYYFDFDTKSQMIDYLSKSKPEAPVYRYYKSVFVTDLIRKASGAPSASLKKPVKNYEVATDFGTDSASELAVQSFTGEAFARMRRFMLGQSMDANTEIEIQRLDDAFAKHSHSIEFYDGYLYRGMRIDEDAKMETFFSKRKQKLPTFTSFTTAVNVQSNFGGVYDKDLLAYLKDGMTTGKIGNNEVHTFTPDQYIDFKLHVAKYFNVEDLDAVLLGTDNILSEYGNQIAATLLVDGDYSAVNAIIPGEASEYDNEAEFMIDRGTVMELTKFAVFPTFNKLGVVMHYTFVKQNATMTNESILSIARKIRNSNND